MEDNNQQFFKQATLIMEEIESRFRDADFDEQVQLRAGRQSAMNNFSKARLAITEKQITCTLEDIKQMQKLRQQIESAPDLRLILTCVGRFTSFLCKRFL
jgi:hypothetical protein